jgi:hypothetical protein
VPSPGLAGSRAFAFRGSALDDYSIAMTKGRYRAHVVVQGRADPQTFGALAGHVAMALYARLPG